MDERAETLLAEILETFQRIYPDGELGRIRAAAHHAEELHRGQARKSGEPYITHPFMVALYCARAGLDELTILGALIHDTVEDTSASLESISEVYGPALARIIDGVTKATKGPGEAVLTYHKLLSRAALDIRVLIIKVFDRLHNLRTLDALPPKKRKRKARESFLYADIAKRLGMWAVARQIQDLILRVLQPGELEILHRQRADENLLAEAGRALQSLERELPQFEVRIAWRPFGMFYDRESGKLKVDIDPSSHYDLLVLTDTPEQVYQAFGVIHRRLRVLPSQVFDYIANPKANDYRSLHTTIYLQGSHKVRIATREMQRCNEDGVLHRFLEQPKAFSYYRRYLDMLAQMTEEQDLRVEDVMSHLAAQGGIQLLTPAGDRIHLPGGATALDFAFQIHTDLGLHMTGAVVNGRVVGIEHGLSDGDVVEVLTSPEAGPERYWMELPRTVVARQAIQRALAQAIQSRAVELARRLLKPHVETLLAEDGREAFARISEEMLEEFLYGGPKQLHRWVEILPAFKPLTRLSRSELYQGFCAEVTERDPFFQTTCSCSPLPGEPIRCELIAGQGGSLHLESCGILRKNKRRLPACWRFSDPLPVIYLEIRGADRPALAADVLMPFQGFSLSGLNAHKERGEGVVMLQAISIDLHTLANVASRLRQIPGLRSIFWSLRRRRNSESGPRFAQGSR